MFFLFTTLTQSHLLLLNTVRSIVIATGRQHRQRASQPPNTETGNEGEPRFQSKQGACAHSDQSNPEKTKPFHAPTRFGIKVPNTGRLTALALLAATVLGLVLLTALLSGDDGLVHAGHDGVAGLLQGLALGVVLGLLGLLVHVQPGHGLLDVALDDAGVPGLEGATGGELLHGVEDGVGVVLELGLGLHAGAVDPVLLLELTGITDHTVDVISGQAALVVGDGDGLLLAGALLLGGDVQDTVGVDLEGDLNLGDTAGGRGDSLQVEVTELVAVLGHGALALVHLDLNNGLHVLVGGEGLALLDGDGGVALDEGGHHASDNLDTVGQGGDVEQEETLGGLGLTSGQDVGLDGGTVGDSLIGVDGLVELLTVEEVRDQGLDLGDTGGATDQDDVVDGALVHLTVLHDLLDGLEGVAEEVAAHLLEAGTGDGALEVDVVEEGVNLDGGLGNAGEGALGTLAGGAQTADGTVVAGHVALVLALELLHEVGDHAVVEVLTTQMGVTSGGLDLEEAANDGQEGNIEGTTTQIEDQDVALLLILGVQAVGDGGGGGLVDDTEDLKVGDLTGILGGLTLVVVEVGGHGDNGLLNLLAELDLSNFLHLHEDHGGDLLGVELLGLTVEVDLEQGLVVSLGDNLEGPVLHVGLDGLIGELAADQALGVEDGVGG
eukprot:195120_1